eukprot:gene4488-4811_t
MLRSYKDVFSGGVDECERMIGCLQYCCFVPIHAHSSIEGFSFHTDDTADIQTFFEKGSVYRGMISDLHDFPLLDQCFYILQKFTEFRERVEVVDIELEFKEVEIDQLLLHLLNRVKDLTSFQLTHAPLLNAFYLAKIEEVLLLFYVVDSSDNERALCHVIVVSDDVTCLPALPLSHLLQWLDPLSELLHRHSSIIESSDVFELRLVGLLRDLAAVNYTGVRPDVDFFDDQFIALHEHFQEARKAEAVQSIGSLRHQILEMLDDVSSAAALMASEEKKEIDGDRVEVKEVVGGSVVDQLSVDPVTSPMPITPLERESYAFRTDVATNTLPDPYSLLPSQLMSPPRSQIEEEGERGGAEKVDEVAATPLLISTPLPKPLPILATHTPSLPQPPSSIIKTSEKKSPVNEEVLSLPLPLPQPQKEDSDALFNTQTITQPLSNTSSEEEKQALSASLVAHLIASTDKEEDLLDYVRRAYSAIRNKYVDEALISNATATSSSLSSLLPPPPRTPFMEEPGVDPLPRPPTATASDVILPPPSLSATDVVREEREEEGVSKEVVAVEEVDDVDEEGREAFLHLLRKHEGEEVKEEVMSEGGKAVEEVMEEEETCHIPTPPLSQPTTASEVVEAEEEEKAKSSDIIITAPDVTTEPAASPAPPDTSFSPRHNDISELDRLRLKAASLIFKLEEANTSSPPPPPPSLPHSETVTSGSSDVRESGGFPVSEPVPALPSTSSTSPENNDLTHQSSLGLEGETREEVVKSVVTSVSESVASLGSGRRVKNAIIIDQMRQIRSNIEYDHLQRRIERNQRRVKIGEKIVLLLRQQKLLVPTSTASSTTPSNSNKPQLLSIVSNPVDPPTAPPLRSPPRQAVIVQESHHSPTPSKDAIKEVADQGSGRGGGPGVVWNIESEPNDRPKSRTRAARASLLPKRSTPNDDVIPVVVAPSTPPLASPSKAMQRPQSRPHSVRDVNLSSPPQKHAVAIPDTSTPPLPPSQRSQSAQRSNRRVSSGPTKTLTNHTQIRNAINHVCLAGAHQAERRNEVLELLDFYHQGRDMSSAASSDVILYEEFRGIVNHFVLMFYKAKSLAFKSIYLLLDAPPHAPPSSSQKRLVKVFGKGGPGQIADNDVLIKEFLKFETSSKSFKAIPVRAISNTTDAIILEPPKAKNLPL